MGRGSDTVILAIGVIQLYWQAEQQETVGTNGTSTTTHTVLEWKDELIFGVLAAGKFTPLPVPMRNQSQSYMTTTPGLIAL